MISCVLIWFFSFLIITPVIFELSYGNFGFGGFGWDSAMGICEVNKMEICREKYNTEKHQVTSCRNPVGLASGALIYLVGTTIPFLVLLLSHIALEIYFLRKKVADPVKCTPYKIRYSQSPLGSSQTTSKNQMMLVLLSLAYVFFTGPLLPVELGVQVGLIVYFSFHFKIHFRQIDVFWYLVCYSWYWWMYASNVFIYIVTDQDFRKVYRRFLKDMFTGCFNGYLEGY